MEEGEPQEFRRRGSGSGFIISEDGYIITNNHVVGEADAVSVTLDDGRELEAKVIGADPDSDVALIKVDAKNLPYLEFADSSEVEVGQWVLAFGSPFGLSRTVTAGIVSATGRKNVGMLGFEDFIQTDAAINPGNSGGPLVDLYGRVVGVNTLIYSRSGGYMGIGFAIPVNMAKWVKDQLLAEGDVTRGYLGVWIQDLDNDIAQSFGLDRDRRGALIGEVGEDSPAADAGLKHGDVVVEMDGTPVRDSASLRNRVAMIAPGNNVDLTVLRGDDKANVTVTIGERPENVETATSRPGREEAAPEFEGLGIRVQDLSDDIAAQLGYEGEDGVVVTRVNPNSPAAEAGIRQGNLIQQVNRQTVSNVQEFRSAFEEAPKDRPISLLLSDGRASRFVALRMN
jgi:serine protease Do